MTVMQKRVVWNTRRNNKELRGRWPLRNFMADAGGHARLMRYDVGHPMRARTLRLFSGHRGELLPVFTMRPAPARSNFNKRTPGKSAQFHELVQSHFP